MGPRDCQFLLGSQMIGHTGKETKRVFVFWGDCDGNYIAPYVTDEEPRVL